MAANVPPRLLHCAETIKGGIATYLRELIPLQCQTFGAGNIVVLIPESQRAELSVPHGVKLETFADKGGRVSNSLRLALRALRIVWSERVDIVHVHSTFAGATVRPLIAFGSRASLVYCAHGWAWDRPMKSSVKRIVQIIERLLARITDRIVCISEHERRTALAAGIPPSKLVVVLNAISKRPVPAEKVELAWPNAKLRVLFVGRLDHQKGVDVLISALRLLGEDFHAVIAGTPVLDGDDAMIMPDNVTRLGWLTSGQLVSLFASAHVLVVPSRWEGFGLIAAEAMRAGIPVVASDVGGIPEVVEDGVTGVVIPAESPVALAEAIRNLDAEKLRRMGNAGRERVADLFTMERLHRELDDVYASLGDNPRKNSCSTKNTKIFK